MFHIEATQPLRVSQRILALVNLGLATYGKLSKSAIPKETAPNLKIELVFRHSPQNPPQYLSVNISLSLSAACLSAVGVCCTPASSNLSRNCMFLPFYLN